MMKRELPEAALMNHRLVAPSHTSKVGFTEQLILRLGDLTREPRAQKYSTRKRYTEGSHGGPVRQQQQKEIYC